MFRFYEEGVDIVEPAVGCFGHKRTGPALENCAMGDLPFDDRIAHHADTMCIRNTNWTFEKATLFDPGGACHFAVAVEGKPG